MKTIKFHELEEILFNEWEEQSKLNGHWECDKNGSNFAPDGLINKGEIVYNESGEWIRDPGDEEQLWSEAPKRVMFITKELHSTQSWDQRGETGRKNDSKENNIIITSRFYKNIMLWLYLLLNTKDNKTVPSYKEAINNDNYRYFYDRTPLVRINCKKQLGGRSISPTILKYYMEQYKELLIRNIMMYDADIIVCCDGPGVIKDFVKDNCFHDMKKINNWIYYSASTNKIIVYAYHPSYYKIGYEDIYNEMKGDFKDFLSTHPSFMKPNR